MHRHAPFGEFSLLELGLLSVRAASWLGKAWASGLLYFVSSPQLQPLDSSKKRSRAATGTMSRRPIRTEGNCPEIIARRTRSRDNRRYLAAWTPDSSRVECSLSVVVIFAPFSQRHRLKMLGACDKLFRVIVTRFWANGQAV